MKLGPFEIRRALAATQKLAAPHERAEGASGTLNLDGYLIPDEYNPDLRGKDGLETFQRMLRSDGSARESYLHCVAPILNANWEIDPAGEDPDQLEQAAFAHEALFEWPTESFPQLLTTAMKYLPQGFQLFETLEQVVDKQLDWIDPKTNQGETGERRQFVCWKRWAHRRPETVWRWLQSEGELQAVQQNVIKDGEFIQPVIQAENLALFINEREGDDFYGQSIFRSGYFAWSLKQLIEKIAGISIERHGVGINVGYIPESSKGDETMIARMEQMLQDLSAGERPYLIFPGPKQGAGGKEGEGFMFEIVTPSSGLPDFVPLLEYLRGEIKGTVVARFSELGHGSTGARATGDVQSQVWYDSLHAVADYIASVFNEQLKRLIDKNFPGVEKYPKLVARDIETRSLQNYADALSKLALAQLIRPDRSARTAARKAADIPDEDEDDPVHIAAEQQLANDAMPPLPPGAPGRKPAPAQQQTEPE